jgi:large subunit ribosomal protein L17
MKVYIELLGSEKVIDEKRQKRAEARAKRAEEARKAMEEANAQAGAEGGEAPPPASEGEEQK